MIERLHAVRAVVGKEDIVKVELTLRNDEMIEVNFSIHIWSKPTREIAHEIRRALKLTDIKKGVMYRNSGKIWSGKSTNGAEATIYFNQACKISGYEKTVLPAEEEWVETIKHDAKPERTEQKPIYDCDQFEDAKEIALEQQGGMD